MSYLTTISAEREDSAIDKYLELLGQGHKDALDKIYSLCNRSLYAFAISILKNDEDAQDITQEAFIKIYQNAPLYESKGKPLAWMLTIVRNLCLEKIRQERKYASVNEEDWEVNIPSRETISSVDRIVIEDCLSLLSIEQREIVSLHVISGFKHWEIAKFLDMPLPTVLSKYHRAIKKIRNELVKEDLLND